MSELINDRAVGGVLRLQLFTGTSMMALVAALGLSRPAQAEGARNDTPSVWIDLGGQLERVDGREDQFSPGFIGKVEAVPFDSPLSIQRPARYSEGLEGAVTFHPHDSDWSFIAAIRYGRSNNHKHLHEQTPNPARDIYVCVLFTSFSNCGIKPGGPKAPERANFLESTASYKESHGLLDFTIGRDVGLGMFGTGSNAKISAGVRYAQFSSFSNVGLDAVPDRYVPNTIIVNGPPNNKYEHRYDGAALLNRSFRGIGPTIAVAGSSPFAGTAEDGQFSFEWGVNAALLFGRQKVTGHHETASAFYHWNKYLDTAPLPSRHVESANIRRSRSVVVPNLGGFAGVSARYSNAKLSVGYRTDFFFSAMDEGIDTRHSKGIGFHGPFATISIGLRG